LPYSPKTARVASRPGPRPSRLGEPRSIPWRLRRRPRPVCAWPAGDPGSPATTRRLHRRRGPLAPASPGGVPSVRPRRVVGNRSPLRISGCPGIRTVNLPRSLRHVLSLIRRGHSLRLAFVAPRPPGSLGPACDPAAATAGRHAPPGNKKGAERTGRASSPGSPYAAGPSNAVPPGTRGAHTRTAQMSIALQPSLTWVPQPYVCRKNGGLRPPARLWRAPWSQSPGLKGLWLSPLDPSMPNMMHERAGVKWLVGFFRFIFRPFPGGLFAVRSQPGRRPELPKSCMTATLRLRRSGRGRGPRPIPREMRRNFRTRPGRIPFKL